MVIVYIIFIIIIVTSFITGIILTILEKKNNKEENTSDVSNNDDSVKEINVNGNVTNMMSTPFDNNINNQMNNWTNEIMDTQVINQFNSVSISHIDNSINNNLSTQFDTQIFNNFNYFSKGCPIQNNSFNNVLEDTQPVNILPGESNDLVNKTDDNDNNRNSNYYVEPVIQSSYLVEDTSLKKSVQAKEQKDKVSSNGQTDEKDNSQIKNQVNISKNDNSLEDEEII